MRAVIAFSVLVANVATAESPRRFELSLSPVSVQLNGKFADHVGTFGTATWYPVERIGLQLTGGGNWLAQQTQLTSQLNRDFAVSPASAVAWSWGVFAGVEVEPFVGVFRIPGGAPIRFGVTLGGGLGAGGTRHFLFDGSSVDTGARLMSLVTFGLKAVVAERMTLRAGLRNVMHSSAIKTVNGCPVDDEGPPPLGGPFRCGEEVEVGPVESVNLLRVSHPSILNNVQFSVSVGVLF